MKSNVFTYKMAQRMYFRYRAAKQQGAILVVSLIILLMLTILGVTSMQVTIMEEKMSNNTRDRSIAFQAAEAAMRLAETEINDMAGISDFSDAAHVDYLYNSDEDITSIITNVSTWETTDSLQVTSTIDGVSSQPRYLVQLLSDASGGSAFDNTRALDETGYGKDMTGGSDYAAFVIYARGTGATDSAQVLLQAYYGKNF